MRNRFKVPKRAWEKWSELARGLFNEVYGAARRDYDLIHPKSKQTFKARVEFEVVAWNSAWRAASFVSRGQE